MSTTANLTPIKSFENFAALLGKSTQMYIVTESQENGRYTRSHHPNPGAWRLDRNRYGYRIMEINTEGGVYPALTDNWYNAQTFVEMINVAYTAAQLMKQDVLNQVESTLPAYLTILR